VNIILFRFQKSYTTMSQRRISALCQIARIISAAGTPGVVNWQSQLDAHAIIIAEFAVTKSMPLSWVCWQHEHGQLLAWPSQRQPVASKHQRSAPIAQTPKLRRNPYGSSFPVSAG
jgi:hypothetical protein